MKLGQNAKRRVLTGALASKKHDNYTPRSMLNVRASPSNYGIQGKKKETHK